MANQSVNRAGESLIDHANGVVQPLKHLQPNGLLETPFRGRFEGALARRRPLYATSLPPDTSVRAENSRLQLQNRTASARIADKT